MLSVLQSKEVVSSEVADTVRQILVDVQKNRELIQFIHCLPIEKIQDFIEVLKNFKQNHVAKFLELSKDKLGIFVLVSLKI